MEFRSILSEDFKQYISNSGEPYLEMYEYKVDKNGCKILVKTDEVDNVYDKIQSYRESTDINNIMAKFALGDESVLNVNKGYYVDTTDLPKDIFEVYNRGLKAEQVFDSFPVDFKEMFYNSPSSFFLSDEKEFSDKVNRYNEKFKNHQFDVKTDEEGVTYNE